MTDLHRARAELACARRSRQRLLAAVLHDLRSPMSTILLWERVLRERFHEVDVRERALDAIRDSATAQSELIASLSDVAALLDGTATLQLERIALDTVVTTSVELQSEAAERKQVSLMADCRPALGHIDADRARLVRIISQLIDKGVRSIASGGALTIALRRKDDIASIAIGDLQRDHAGDTEVRTLDLPFVIAHEVLALHGGELRATRPERGGTPTFWVDLPLSQRRS